MYIYMVGYLMSGVPLGDDKIHLFSLFLFAGPLYVRGDYIHGCVYIYILDSSAALRAASNLFLS